MKWKAYKCKKCGNVFAMSGRDFPGGITCWECGGEDSAERYEKGDLKENMLISLYNFKKGLGAFFVRFWRFFKEWFVYLLAIVGVLLFAYFFIYSVFSFSRHECDRIHNLTGYETDWDIYGGCYVKKDGEWIRYDKYMNVNITK